MLAHLAQGWSPEQVAGRLAVEAGRGVISHESIYRFLYRQLARTKDYGWRHYLPRARWKRGWRGRKGGSPASFMALRRPLAERPQSAADRRTPGHWEADLMLFRTYGQVVLTLHERHSRLLLALRPPGKASRPIASALAHLLGQVPPAWRRTVTFDNGTEFARHYRLHELGIETFFCDTHSPWQKGGVENAIGRLRRTLPRKTDLAAVPQERFTQLIQAYNNTPRKCLAYRTPAEIFGDSVLHLKCESTPGLARYGGGLRPNTRGRADSRRSGNAPVRSGRRGPSPYYQSGRGEDPLHDGQLRTAKRLVCFGRRGLCGVLSRAHYSLSPRVSASNSTSGSDGRRPFSFPRYFSFVGT